MRKTLVTISILFFLCIPFTAQTVSAKADGLIIQDDGNIELVITNNGVLGIATSPTEATGQHAAPPSPSTPEKTVPLVAPHTESTVQINPPINNGKEVNVTITTKAVNPPQTPVTAPTTPPQVITKDVNQVVAQGTNGTPVITVTSDKAHQLTIHQGSTQVTTSTPLQINTGTHSMSVSSPKGTAPIHVLPNEALQGIVATGLFNPQSARQAKISLTNDTGGIDYTIHSQRQGKLFGMFSVTTPIEVQLSAQNGKVVKTSQSLLFNLLGSFVK